MYRLTLFNYYSYILHSDFTGENIIKMVSKFESNPDADIKLSDLNLESNSRPPAFWYFNRRKSIIFSHVYFWGLKSELNLNLTIVK
jgi:hypothetical protein